MFSFDLKIEIKKCVVLSENDGEMNGDWMAF